MKWRGTLAEINENSKIIKSDNLVDLDQLPLPKYTTKYSKKFSYRPMLKYPTGFIEATRGCPYSCGYYCTYGENQGKIIRTHSVKALIEIMKELKKIHGFKSFQFRDPVFGLKKDFIDTGKLKYQHHGFPLDLAALNAEKVLGCVENNETKFKLLNELYENQDSWASGSDINSINQKIFKISNNYGLKNDKNNSCLSNQKLEDEILNERINANKKYSIDSTPTILINEKKYDGKHNYEDFKKEILKFL